MKTAIIATIIALVAPALGADCYGKHSGADRKHYWDMMNARDRVCQFGNNWERIEKFAKKEFQWTARSSAQEGFPAQECWEATSNILDICWNKDNGGGEWKSLDGLRTYSLNRAYEL